MPICRKYSNGLCDNKYSKKSKRLDFKPGIYHTQKGKPRITSESSDPVSAFVACFFRTYGFPLMAALMLMLMMFIIMRMLVCMFFCNMLMFLTIVRMGHFLVIMLVLMLILVMAAHFLSPPFSLPNNLKYSR